MWMTLFRQEKMIFWKKLKKSWIITYIFQSYGMIFFRFTGIDIKNVDETIEISMNDHLKYLERLEMREDKLDAILASWLDCSHKVLMVLISSAFFRIQIFRILCSSAMGDRSSFSSMFLGNLFVLLTSESSNYTMSSTILVAVGIKYNYIYVQSWQCKSKRNVL